MEITRPNVDHKHNLQFPSNLGLDNKLRPALHPRILPDVIPIGYKPIDFEHSNLSSRIFHLDKHNGFRNNRGIGKLYFYLLCLG